MSSRYTCAVAGVRTASLFEAAQYSTAQMDENSRVRHPSRDTWVPPSFNCCEHEVQVGLPEILLWVLLDLEWDAQWVCHARPQGRPHDTVLGSPASSCRSGTPPFPLRRQMQLWKALEAARGWTASSGHTQARPSSHIPFFSAGGLLLTPQQLHRRLGRLTRHTGRRGGPGRARRELGGARAGGARDRRAGARPGLVLACAAVAASVR